MYYPSRSGMAKVPGKIPPNRANRKTAPETDLVPHLTRSYIAFRERGLSISSSLR
jgi:hypothetical protein